MEYNDDNGPITDNNIEVYSLKLNNYVRIYPNNWKFITKIQSEENSYNDLILNHLQVVILIWLLLEKWHNIMGSHILETK
jgi:hypothetical protein